MGKATIVSGGSAGLYAADVNVNRESIDEELAEIAASIDQLDIRIIAAEEDLRWAQSDIEAAKFNLDEMIRKYIEAGPENDPDEEGEPPTPSSFSVVDAHNAIRLSEGLGALSLNSELSQAAASHAEYMADNGFVGHKGPGGTYVQDRATQAGYAWASIGENCAGGYDDIPSLMNAWMNSDSHRQNILTSFYTEIGFGYAYKAESPHRTYVVVTFGSR